MSDNQNICDTTKPGTAPSLLPGALDKVLKRIKDRNQPQSLTDSEVARELGERLVYRVAMNRGRRYSPQACSLSTFQVYDKKQSAALESLKDFCTNLRENIEKGRGLILYGPAGTGKDHLLSALQYGAAKRGIPSMWANGQEILGTFYDLMDRGKPDEEYLRELCEPTILAISDPIPPLGELKAWDLRPLYRLVDRRYCDLKVTWITLNAMSVEDADKKLSAPIFDRLRHDALIVPCFWPSYRERTS